MRTSFLAAASLAAALPVPSVALATDQGAAAGATAGAVGGAVFGGPVGAAVGAGVGAAAGGAATGPNRGVIERRGSTTGSVGCSTTTKQTSDAAGTTTKQRTDC
jgi:hypothetical protein